MTPDYEDITTQAAARRAKRLALVARIARRLRFPVALVSSFIALLALALLVRHRILFPMRVTTLTCVDSATGHVVAAGVDLLPPNAERQFESDPFEAKLSASSPSPGQIVVTRNIDVTLPVSCHGYDVAYVRLTSSPPPNVVVRMSATK